MAFGPIQTKKQPGGMMMASLAAEHPGGDIWWVNATGGSDSAGYGQAPDTPFASLVYAETQAGTYDTIYIMPGHTETLTGNPSLTLDVIGLKVIGLGGRTKKPAFLIDAAATAHILINAADTVLRNVTLKAGHADVAKAINITAAGAEIRDCNIIQNTANENFLIGILTSAAADDLLVDNCFMTTVDAAGTEGIEIVGACNNVTISNNYLKGPWSVSAISVTTVACLDMQILSNRIINTLAGDDLAGCVDIVAASTGMLANNMLYMEDNTDILTAVDSSNLSRVNNLCANEYGQEANFSATQSA